MISEPVIIKGIAPTKIIVTGRPKGVGTNLNLLKRLDPGDPYSCIWGLSRTRMKSISNSASRERIKIRVRRQPDDTYGIWRC